MERIVISIETQDYKTLCLVYVEELLVHSIAIRTGLMVVIIIERFLCPSAVWKSDPLACLGCGLRSR